jgi:hypothetical protein
MQEQFRLACGHKSSFVADRLFEIFRKQSDNVKLKEDQVLDFVGYAKGVSTFCPTADMEEKMFGQSFHSQIIFIDPSQPLMFHWEYHALPTKNKKPPKKTQSLFLMQFA